LRRHSLLTPSLSWLGADVDLARRDPVAGRSIGVLGDDFQIAASLGLVRGFDPTDLAADRRHPRQQNDGQQSQHLELDEQEE
jgi:hypothetical protein